MHDLLRNESIVLNLLRTLSVDIKAASGSVYIRVTILGQLLLVNLYYLVCRVDNSKRRAHTHLGGRTVGLDLCERVISELDYLLILAEIYFLSLERDWLPVEAEPRFFIFFNKFYIKF